MPARRGDLRPDLPSPPPAPSPNRLGARTRRKWNWLGRRGAFAAGRQRSLPLYAGGALILTAGLSILALVTRAGLEGVAGAALVGQLFYAAAVLRLVVRETGAPAVNRFVLITLLPLTWCAAAVAITGQLIPGNSLRSAALGLVLYLILILPLAPGWRTELRRLRD